MTRLLTMCAELDEGLTVPLEVQSSWRKAIRTEAAAQGKPRGRGFVRTLGTVAAALVLLVGGTFAYRISQLPSYTPTTEQMTYGSNQVAGLSEGANSADAVLYAASLTGGEADAGELIVRTDGDALDDSVPTGEVTPKIASAATKPVVLKSASRRIETTTFDQSMEVISTSVAEYAGWFERSSVIGQPIAAGQLSGRAAEMTVRVPEDRLEDFLASLDVVGTLTFKKESADDISSQYYDVSSRLASFKAQRDRLNELITTAASLSDMLELEDMLYEVEQEIDSFEGKLRGWNSLASLSTVTISLSEVAVRNQVQSIGTTLEERVRNAFYDSINWLNAFAQDALVVLVQAMPTLVIAVPLLIILCLIVAGFRRRRRRKGK